MQSTLTLNTLPWRASHRNKFIHVCCLFFKFDVGWYTRPTERLTALHIVSCRMIGWSGRIGNGVCVPVVITGCPSHRQSRLQCCSTCHSMCNCDHSRHSSMPRGFLPTYLMAAVMPNWCRWALLWSHRTASRRSRTEYWGQCVVQPWRNRSRIPDNYSMNRMTTLKC